MSLEGKTALVTGATGTVGNGILFQLLREGATVIAPVRGSKDALLASLDGANVSNLDVVVADVSDEPSVVELAKHIKDKYGSIDHVITSVGGWWQKGPLLQLPTEEFLKEYRTYVLPHFLLAKHLLPLIKPARESSFTFVTGSAGEGVILLDSGLVTAHLAALYGVVMCTQAEYEDKELRVNELRIGAVIKRHSEAFNPALPDEIRNLTGEFSHRLVGKAAVALALDAAGSNQQRKIGPTELQQLERD